MSWIRILRLPNLLTVPGDLWVGMALAGGIQWGRGETSGLLAVCCLYLAGMLQNALVDRERDAIQAPERPLPSGELTVASVSGVMRLLFNLGVALGLLLGGIWAVVLLASCVWSYNSLKEQVPMVGCMLMGACRGFAVLIGAMSVTDSASDVVWIGVGVWTLYIAAVTGLARREHGEGFIQPCHIGWLIRFLFVLQAGVLLSCSEFLYAGIVVVFALIHFLAGKKIAAS